MRMKLSTSVKISFCFSILLFFAASFTLALTDTPKTYYYPSIKIDISINPDSTFDVTEFQTYNLTGSFGYFYREIELKDLDHISNIEVFDGDNRKLNKDEYELSRKGNLRTIKWNFSRKDFMGESKSWTIKYKVHGGLRFFETWDELYWNAIFSDRGVPVIYTETIVHLPAEVSSDKISQRMFIGQLGSKNESTNYQVIDSKTVKFWGNNVMPGEFLTIVVTWPKGLVEKPFLYRNQLINWIALIISIIIPIFVFTLSLRNWRKKGKDPKIDKTIIAQYEPPENLPPAVVEILINQKFNVRIVTATMIDLAVKGFLKIKEGKKGFFTGREYIFEKLEKQGEFNSFEKEIMEGMFSKGDIVKSSDLKNKFYRRLKDIKKLVHQEMVKTGYVVSNIQKVRIKYQLPYILFFVLAGFILFFSGIAGLIGQAAIFIAISLFISAVIGIIFGQYMPALTSKGAEEKWKWLGFKEYLHTAERFRIGAETVETFSKYLSYAIVFEVEKEWADRFADLKYQQPSWYTPAMIYTSAGQGIAPSFNSLTSNISSFTSSISSTFSSSPGGSGTGAGGGAGGGGGGGGGGAG